MGALLRLEKFSVELPTPSGWIRPVNEVSFDLQEGEVLGLVGESGCGKTMLSLGLMGLEPHAARRSGRAWFEISREGVSARVNLAGVAGEGMRKLRGREIAMIFQEPMTALDPVMRIGAQIEEAIRVHESKITRAQLYTRTLEALELAAVPQPGVRARQFPHQLSGGLRQRAMIAMALAMHPRLLIADEPTTALDVTVQKQIVQLLTNLCRELHLALVFITHDLGVVAQIAQRVAVMYAGRIVEMGPTAEVLTHPAHPYTAGLLRAAPRLEGKKLAPIAGAVPKLDDLPPGCAFSPRCEFHRSECDADVPDLREASPEHSARCILVP
jgi:peptide/nickel transport system ATP-binding protein